MIYLVACFYSDMMRVRMMSFFLVERTDFKLLRNGWIFLIPYWYRYIGLDSGSGKDFLLSLFFILSKRKGDYTLQHKFSHADSWIFLLIFWLFKSKYRTTPLYYFCPVSVMVFLHINLHQHIKHKPIYHTLKLPLRFLVVDNI